LTVEEGEPLAARATRWARTHRALLLGVLAMLAASPSVAWIAQDREAWSWDLAWYGEVTVNLYYLLLHDVSGWMRLMGTAFGQKAPGVAWLGQAFVPLGQALGSVDAGLLGSILLTQVLTAILVGRAILRLTRSGWIAAAGLLAVATGPLFVALSHHYFAEPLQTLSVAWFVLIAALAPGWNRPRILGNLLAATVLAMLAKISSPLYCAGPGLVALWYAWRPRAAAGRGAWRDGRVLAPLVAGLVVGAGTAGWYAVNWERVTWHVRFSSSGPLATLYGWYDTYPASYAYWLRAAQRAFLLPEVLLPVGLLLAAALAVYILRRRRGAAGWDHRVLLAAVAILEILGSLAVFATSPNRETRYLQPLAPYVAVLLAWALHAVGRRAVAALCIALLLYQGGVVYAQAFGATAPRAEASPWLVAVRRNPLNDVMAESIVSRTCSTEQDASRYSMVGVDVGWFNHNMFSYYAAKRRLATDMLCYYTGLGYAETDADRAWERLLALNTRYYLVPSPGYLPSPDDPLNVVNQAVLERARLEEFVGPEEGIGGDLRVHLYVRRGE